MNKIISILIILLSITGLYIFKLGEKLNITPFHITCGAISIYFLIKYLFENKIKTNGLTNILLLSGYIVLVNLTNYKTINISNLIHSMFYILVFIFIFLNKKNQNIITTTKTNNTILILYFINILATFITSIKLNLTNQIFNSIFKYYSIGDTIRPCGFSSEPSYAAIIISCAMYTNIMMFYSNKTLNTLPISKSIIFNKILLFKWMLLFYTISIILINSSYGYIMMFINILTVYFYNIHKIKKHINYLIIIAIIPTILILYNHINTEPINRLIEIISISLKSTNIQDKLNEIRLVDSSASMRLIPFFNFINDIKILDLNFIFGSGSGYTDQYFGSFFPDILESSEKNSISLGIIPSFIHSYGIIGLFILIYFFKKNINKAGFFSYVLLFFTLFNANFNTQIFWFIIIELTFLSHNLTTVLNYKIKTRDYV